MGLERDDDCGITRHTMRMHTALGPGGEARHKIDRFAQRRRIARQRAIGRQLKAARDPCELCGGECCRTAAQRRPFGLDLAGKALGAELTHQDLDAGLIEIVATTEAVIDPQDGFDIVEQFGLGQEGLDQRRDHRRAPQTAARPDLEAQLALRVSQQLQTDIVDLHRCAIAGRRRDCDLEFARQKREFGMEGRPLTQQLAIGPRIDEFIGRNTGEMVGGDIAHAVAAGLDAVHLDRGELGQDVGHAGEFGPVDLQILARAEMPVAAVVGVADLGEFAQLERRQRAVRNRNAQHRRVLLHIEAVLQAKRFELVFGQLTGEKTAGLVAKLRNPFVDQSLVVAVVAVHGKAVLEESARKGAREHNLAPTAPATNDPVDVSKVAS